MARLLVSCLVGALLAGPALAQQSSPPPGNPVSVEFSSKLDTQQDTDGGIGDLDPGQVLYVEPPDAPSDGNPKDATDFFPGIESGREHGLVGSCGGQDSRRCGHCVWQFAFGSHNRCGLRGDDV